VIDPQQFIEEVGHHPYLGLAILIIPSGLGVPIPEDISLIVAGYLCYKNPEYASLWIMIPWAMFLVMGSDLLLFYVGRFVGDKIVKVPLMRRMLTPERLEMSRALFEGHGGKILFAARFMPGLRAPLFFTAGHLKVPAWKMVLYDGGAAVLSVPTIILLAYYFGEHFDKVKKLVRAGEYTVLGLIVVIAIVLYVMSVINKRVVNKLSQSAHEKIQSREDSSSLPPSSPKDPQ
jgi:membrane protein DedA with SNARE-associated domain